MTRDYHLVITSSRAQWNAATCGSKWLTDVLHDRTTSCCNVIGQRRHQMLICICKHQLIGRWKADWGKMTSWSQIGGSWSVVLFCILVVMNKFTVLYKIWSWSVDRSCWAGCIGTTDTDSVTWMRTLMLRIRIVNCSSSCEVEWMTTMMSRGVSFLRCYDYYVHVQSKTRSTLAAVRWPAALGSGCTHRAVVW